MNPRIIKVKPLDDYQLHLVFENREEKIFDVKPYLKIGVFQKLNNPVVFGSVKPFMGSILWENGVDLCPDTLYMESKNISAHPKKKKNLAS